MRNKLFILKNFESLKSVIKFCLYFSNRLMRAIEICLYKVIKN